MSKGVSPRTRLRVFARDGSCNLGKGVSDVCWVLCAVDAPVCSDDRSFVRCR